MPGTALQKSWQDEAQRRGAKAKNTWALYDRGLGGRRLILLKSIRRGHEAARDGPSGGIRNVLKGAWHRFTWTDGLVITNHKVRADSRY